MFSAPEKDDYQSNLSLNQVVFTWGQANSAIRAAKHDKAASAYLLEEARQLALRETATVFFTLLLAEELADVARENLKQNSSPSRRNTAQVPCWCRHGI